MEHAFFHRLGRILWAGLVVLIVLLAAYVSAGRLLTATMGAYQDRILRELNSRLPVVLEARRLGGEWRAFTPVMVMTGLRLRLPGSDLPPLELGQGRIGIDVFNSIRSGTLQPSDIVLSGLELRGELTATGELRLTGLGGDSGGSADPLREFLLNVEHVSLRGNRLLLTLPSAEVRELELDLELARAGSERRLDATLTSTAGAHISMHAQGLGDPFQPEHFVGQGYLRVRTPQLGAMRAMFADRAPAVWADGTAELELWFNWDKGEPAITARVTGRDLQVAARGWDAQLQLQRLAVEARAWRQGGGWKLFFQDLQVEGSDAVVRVARGQLEIHGDSVRVRSSPLALEPIATLLASQPVLPQRLRDVIATLQPRGTVTALQLQLDTATGAASRWEVAANFEDVAAASWSGAPGIRGATGYARLAPGQGVVLLDSPGLSLEFPTVYERPLEYADLYGALALSWDEDAFRLRSGLLTTQGAEGTAKVLFSLAVPARHSDTGIEMDLLVGLQASQPVHRDKYIPYILNAGLRKWLAESIGEGRIEQGAFLWRGSLTSDSDLLHTVQLAFNVTDTQLAFHPRWPPVLVRDGIVLIDDSRVSVWAEQADLLASSVQQLSAETRVNAAGQLTLDLRGRVHGPAADGLRILNETALQDVIGTGFSAWTATGSLDTELDLHLNLDDAAAANVDVLTRWHDAEVLVMPGNLPLKAINGELAYRTADGVSARALTGTLWGKAVAASVQPLQPGDDGDEGTTAGTVAVKASGSVELADLQRWLQLPLLSVATGVTAVDVDIRLAPGAPPQLSVRSDLRGVSLELPRPWRKAAADSWPFRLQAALQSGTIPVYLQLSPQLAANMDVVDGAVRGASLGIDAPPAPVQAGELHVTGHAELLQVDEWFDFVARHYGGNPLQALAGAVGRGAGDHGAVADADAEPPVAAPASLAVFLDDLRVDELVALRRSLRDVTLDLDASATQWQLSLAADWLAANLAVSRTGAPAQLAIARLDLSGLPEPAPAADERTGGDSTWNLPTVAVSIAEISQAGKRLGALRFDLSSQDDVISADNILGELAHLQLRADAPGHLLWHRGQTPYTHVQGGFEFADLGQTLQYFDYQRIVETEHGALDLQLRWPGAPQDFSLQQAEGELQVHIGKGSFLRATAVASGALRVVSILNLADIVRRLSLPAMFEAGIPFDRVDGTVALQDGTLKVARMDVSGSSSFALSGASDVRTRQVHGELVAKLPVAQNLPWIAAFAASLPVAAGVYVISQVFNKQMNRLSSAVYTIGGTWSDPTATFDRLFDDTAEDAAEPADSGQSSP